MAPVINGVCLLCRHRPRQSLTCHLCHVYSPQSDFGGRIGASAITRTRMRAGVANTGDLCGHSAIWAALDSLVRSLS